jgi:3-isopropylmalate/(R)-2-methylmalate dehydratase large subunit
MSHYDDAGALPVHRLHHGRAKTPIAAGAVQAGGFQVTVGGRRYGKGSSREHSPAAEKLAGIRLVIAESFERIYRQNADNIGCSRPPTWPGGSHRARRADPIDELVAGRDAAGRGHPARGGLLPFGQQHLRDATPGAARRRPRPLTLFEKIVQRHLLHTPVTPDDPQGGRRLLRARRLALHPRVLHRHGGAHAARDAGAAAGAARPDSIVVFEDHTSYMEESPAHLPARAAAQHACDVRGAARLRRGYGLRNHRTLTEDEARADDGSNVAGISHAMMAEHYALPGQLVAGTDSHTPHSGALGCVAFGVGTTDMANAFVTGAVRMTMPPVLRVSSKARCRRRGRQGRGAAPAALPAIRAGGGVGKVFEFGGRRCARSPPTNARRSPT